MNVNLESITEEELNKTRNDFDKAALFFHFSGEIAGIYYLIKGLTIPIIMNYDIDKKSLILGLIAYSALQVPAILCKGLSLTKNEHEKKALEHDEKSKDDFHPVTNYLNKMFSKIHGHFASHAPLYDNLLTRYYL